MEGKTLKPDLRVPEQKTASLSFCDTTPKAFRVWIDQLPMANIGEVSRQLYHAIIELNHLFLAPQQRMQFLELIREKIHFVCNELSRHYLGLAVALPEKQRKIANLSQALQLHLAGGYRQRGTGQESAPDCHSRTPGHFRAVGNHSEIAPALLPEPRPELAGVPPSIPVCTPQQALSSTGGGRHTSASPHQLGRRQLQAYPPAGLCAPESAATG